MMTAWHGYVLLEKTASLNQANFDTLRTSFAALELSDPIFPADFMQRRLRLDAGAELFEAKFYPADVEVSSFVQFMANLFSVDPGDVTDAIIETVSYSGLPGVSSRRWGFIYGANERLQVVRFGQGGSWQDSRHECVAYLVANAAAWGDA